MLQKTGLMAVGVPTDHQVDNLSQPGAPSRMMTSAVIATYRQWFVQRIGGLAHPRIDGRTAKNPTTDFRHRRKPPQVIGYCAGHPRPASQAVARAARYRGKRAASMLSSTDRPSVVVGALPLGLMDLQQPSIPDGRGTHASSAPCPAKSHAESGPYRFATPAAVPRSRLVIVWGVPGH
ncbi:hypothetical protein B1987_09795 [Mycobacterium kansasii]|nr:hypothetical protein B1987_09795 [Mycobacterium kansasii]